MSYSPPPGGPPGGPPPGGPYQQQPPGYGGVPQEHPKATAILVLGICGFLCIIPGIVAIVMGATARNEIAASPGRYGGEGKVNAGFILGIISVVLSLLGTIIALS